MKTIKLKQQAAKQVRQGNPLLVLGDILNSTDIIEGDIVRLVDGKTHVFLGYAIMGKQNKGIGWVFSTSEKQTFTPTFITDLLQRAKMARQSFFEQIQTTAFRLFNAESDGLGGVTIDVYNQSVVVSWYSQGIFNHRSLILNSLQQVLPNYAIFEKCRFEHPPYLTQSLDLSVSPEVVINENGVNFSLDLNDGLMTGIFLDQRDVRKYVLENAENQTVLNTFSYTAAFSVAAALGRALSTVSVDVAKRSVPLSTKQFEVNNLDMTNHQLYVMDVFDYFGYAKKKNLLFDWVILDPPSFARTKKRTFSVTKNYDELLLDAIMVTAKNGRILVSTNASNWEKKDVEAMIFKTFKKVNRTYRVEKTFNQPSDFSILETLPSTAYLKVFVLRLDV